MLIFLSPCALIGKGAGEGRVKHVQQMDMFSQVTAAVRGWILTAEGAAASPHPIHAQPETRTHSTAGKSSFIRGQCRARPVGRGGHSPSAKQVPEGAHGDDG